MPGAADRRAVARCKVFMKPETTVAIANREVKKGDVLSVARVAGIMAAKRTADLIPLCHPLPLTDVSVEIRPERKGLEEVFLELVAKESAS